MTKILHTAIVASIGFFVTLTCVVADEYQVTPGPNEILLTNNGNLLFYNSPVIASYRGSAYLVWMTNEGEIELAVVRDGAITQKQTVHSYKDVINRDSGTADDHAAPAIILDEKKERLIIATSYHGTDMYVYEYKFSGGEVNRIKILEGRYTYPRLLIQNDNIYLLARLQPKGVLKGDLVIRKEMDGFESENPILLSQSGEVIYAGTPVATNAGLLVSYSILNYNTKKLTGYEIVEYDFNLNGISRRCWLGYLLGEGADENRPTGLGADGGTVMVATAYTKTIPDPKDGERADEDQKEVNVVNISVGDISDCSSFRVLEERTVDIPYYFTSVSVNNNLEYIYFDNDKYYSNLTLDKCFGSRNMMYPQMADNYIIYATKNASYSIRNFNNSLLLCDRQPQNENNGLQN